MPAQSETNIPEIVRTVLEHAGAQRVEDARSAAEPLVAANPHQLPAAFALTHLVGQSAFAHDDAIAVAGLVFAAHLDNPEIVGELAGALEVVRDFRFLNAAPPPETIFADVARRATELLEAAPQPEHELVLLSGLAAVARSIGRSWDNVSERCYRRLVDVRPDRWQDQYNLGLFYKTRGRFAEGLAANRRAAELGWAAHEDVAWNLGICATGAGDGEEALRVWRGLNQKLEMGRFGLPEGGYDHVKVRLAQRPIAQRDVRAEPDDPGLEETIWIERLSPCHGIVRSALYEDLGTEYGDVVLFDGAPIVHHTYGDRNVPVFPHLVTLVHAGYHVLRFAGTQDHEGQLAELSTSLPDDAVVYVHTEQVLHLCAACWERPDAHDGAHKPREHRVVTGKLCAPPSLATGALRRAVDEVLSKARGMQLFVPELSRLAGDPARAAVEARRCQMIDDRT